MKKFIENNSKIIIVCSVVVLTIAMITIASMSYAAGNNNIYTRDELSEKVDELTDTELYDNYKTDVLILRNSWDGRIVGTYYHNQTSYISFVNSDRYQAASYATRGEDFFELNAKGLYTISLIISKNTETSVDYTLCVGDAEVAFFPSSIQTVNQSYTFIAEQGDKLRIKITPRNGDISLHEVWLILRKLK